MTNIKSALSIDPGNTTGFARWKNGTLVAIGRTDRDGAIKLTGAECVIIEEPQMYTGRRAKGRAEDIVQLAVLVGALCECFTSHGHQVVKVKPAGWKGQMPKSVCQKRIIGKLWPEELKIVDGLKDHNVWDAIGIGLHLHGRFS